MTEDTSWQNGNIAGVNTDWDPSKKNADTCSYEVYPTDTEKAAETEPTLSEYRFESMCNSLQTIADMYGVTLSFKHPNEDHCKVTIMPAGLFESDEPNYVVKRIKELLRLDNVGVEAVECDCDECEDTRNYDYEVHFADKAVPMAVNDPSDLLGHTDEEVVKEAALDPENIRLTINALENTVNDIYAKLEGIASAYDNALEIALEKFDDRIDFMRSRIDEIDNDLAKLSSYTNTKVDKLFDGARRLHEQVITLDSLQDHTEGRLNTTRVDMDAMRQEIVKQTNITDQRLADIGQNLTNAVQLMNRQYMDLVKLMPPVVDNMSYPWRGSFPKSPQQPWQWPVKKPGYPIWVSVE